MSAPTGTKAAPVSVLPTPDQEKGRKRRAKRATEIARLPCAGKGCTRTISALAWDKSHYCSQTCRELGTK